MKVGFLTSGGDCQGLNAALRGVAKTIYGAVPYAEIYGIHDGFRGLLDANWKKMEIGEFSGILRQGGTILGTSRQPFKTIKEFDESSNVDRLTAMVRNYHKECFDALVILGGNGTHKTAHALSQRGINVVTMPKTIDNDLYGTDYSFGFDSAVSKATDVLDTLHSTAEAHGRIFVCELMGRKAGWVTLYAGIAGGADVILIPEIPYTLESVVGVIENRNQSNKRFSIIAIAEGATTKTMAKRAKKEKKVGDISTGVELVRALDKVIDQEIKVAIPGHFQRGGDPTPRDRVFCSRLGAMAGELVLKQKFGYMVALQGMNITAVPLGDVAGKLRVIPPDNEVLKQARLLGISLGD